MDDVIMDIRQLVYVGTEEDFHRLYEIDSIYEHFGLDILGSGGQPRLKELYQNITKYF